MTAFNALASTIIGLAAIATLAASVSLLVQSASATTNVIVETGNQEASNTTSTKSTINNTNSVNAVLGSLFLTGVERLTSLNRINETYTEISYAGNRTIIPTEGVTSAITNATETGNLTLKLQSNGITFVEAFL